MHNSRRRSAVARGVLIGNLFPDIELFYVEINAPINRRGRRRKGKGEIDFSDNRGFLYYQGMKFGGEIFLIIRGLHNT